MKTKFDKEELTSFMKTAPAAFGCYVLSVILQMTLQLGPLFYIVRILLFCYFLKTISGTLVPEIKNFFNKENLQQLSFKEKLSRFVKNPQTRMLTYLILYLISCLLPGFILLMFFLLILIALNMSHLLYGQIDTLVDKMPSKLGKKTALASIAAIAILLMIILIPSGGNSGSSNRRTPNYSFLEGNWHQTQNDAHLTLSPLQGSKGCQGSFMLVEGSIGGFSGSVSDGTYEVDYSSSPAVVILRDPSHRGVATRLEIVEKSGGWALNYGGGYYYYKN